jgi:actin related protein 2/3 complex subunit 2
VRLNRRGDDPRLCLYSHNSESRDAFVKSVSLLKRNALAAPFEKAFQTQKSLESEGSGSGDLMAVHYRDEEAIYIQASQDRVTVIFSTVFREETDRVIGKVFLQVALSRFLLVHMLTSR